MYAYNFFWDKDTADQIQVVTEGENAPCTTDEKV